MLINICKIIMEDIHDNYEQMNNCTYAIKHSFLNKNYNDIKQMNNFFLGNNLYLCKNIVCRLFRWFFR